MEFFYLRDTSISPSISDICLNVPIYGDTLWPPYCHHHWLWFCLALFFMEAVTTCHVSVLLCLLERHLHNGVTFYQPLYTQNSARIVTEMW